MTLYNDAVLADSPVFYWKMDETSGAFANSGSAGGTTTVGSGVTRNQTAHHANLGKSASFNATANAYFRQAANASTFDGTYTVEVWFKTTDTDCTLIWFKQSPYWYMNITATGKLNFVADDTKSGTISMTSSASVNDNAWHHAVAVVDTAGGTSRLYLDGSQVATTTVAPGTFSTNGDVEVGDSRSSFSPNGLIDEVAIYPTSLSGARVSAHYAAATATTVNAGYTAQASTASAAMPEPVFYGNVQKVAVTEDALVWAGFPNTNYASDTTYTPSSGSNSLAFLKFASLLGSEFPVTQRLYLDTGVGAGNSFDITVYTVTASWDEGTITWNNKPSTTLYATRTDSTDANGGLDIDITGADVGYGIAIRFGSTTAAIASSENATVASRPYALVTTAAQANAGYSVEVLTASATAPDVAVLAVGNVSNSADVMTASVLATDVEVGAEVQFDFDHEAEPAEAQAEMSNSVARFPVEVTVEVATASAESFDAEIDTELGVHYAVPALGASAGILRPLVNGQVIVMSESDDNYFQRVFAAGPNRWLRLNELSGTTAFDRALNAVGADYFGVTVGQNEGPDDRHSVYFNGSAYIKQREPGGSNTDESYPAGSGDVRSTLEFSIRTDKANQFIMFGQDSVTGVVNTSPTAPKEIYLKNGKIHYRTITWNFQTGGITNIHEFTGFTNLADGEWHHIVIRGMAADSFGQTGGLEVWIDGKFEIRRYQAQHFNGFPDYIGSRPDAWNLGALPSSQNFVGDMSEVVFYQRRLGDDEIPRHYYDFMGWRPIGAEPAEAFAFMTDGARGKGNQKRALYLWWNRTVDAFAIGGGPATNKFNFDPMLGAKGNFGIYEREGLKVFSMSVFEPNAGSAYRDPVTDRQTPINLETDVDIEDYDVIMFGDWPDENNWEEIDFYKQLYGSDYMDRFVAQLLKVNREKGIGILVTHPRMAVDLGIVDRVEFIPPTQENSIPYGGGLWQGNASALYDYGSAVKFPWNWMVSSGMEGHLGVGSSFNGQPMNTDPNYLHNKAFFFQDTNHNNRFRVRALIEGLTDIPSYMIEDQIYHVDYDPWGWQSSGFKYLHRMEGLQIGDEFNYHGHDGPGGIGLDVSRSRGTYASPLANVKAGVVVTTFGLKYWQHKEYIDNPWKDYATTIVLRPGDQLNGQPLGGKIFVNFTEQPHQNVGAVAVQVLPGSAEDDGTVQWPDNYNIDTPAQREWEWSEGRKSLSSTQNQDNQSATIVLPDGNTQVVNVSGSDHLTMGRSSNLFPIKWYPKYDMVQRGMWWLRDTPEFNPGDEIVGAEPIAATAAMPSPTVVAERDADVSATPMRALAEARKVAEDASGDADVYTLPMEATATITGYAKVIYVAPMTASAQMVESFEMVRATGEQVVLVLHHADATVYLKEES